MEYTKGEIAGGWVHVMMGKVPVALVHPKHVDKFLAAPDLYEALKELSKPLIPRTPEDSRLILKAEQALAKAEGLQAKGKDE